MTTAARNALNTVDTFLKQQQEKIATLQKDIAALEKKGDETRLQVKKKELEGVQQVIKTFEVKRTKLFADYPELNQKESLMEKFAGLFSKPPVVVAAKPMKKQESTEEVNFDPNNSFSGSPRNSLTKEEAGAGERRSLLKSK